MSQRPKLKVLVEELHSVKTKWRPIGIQLEVPTSSIKIIGSAHKDDPEQAFTELMDEWLNQTDPEPSWAAIVEALRSRSVGEVRLAESVERNMCPKQADNPTPPANAELQQLEAVEAVLTDHLSLEHNHTLELQMIPPHEIKEVPPKVRNAIKTLAKSLNRLRIDTYHHVVAIEVSVNEFRVVICNPERLWEEEDRKRILLADTIEFIFAVISDKKYLNWQNYELLEEIIEAYGDSKLKGKFETYCKDMEKFENESPLQDVKNIIFTPLRSNGLLMKVPIPNGISSPTLSLVRTMKNGLKRNGYPHAICCHHIGENSPLAIFFIIPRPFIPTISMAKLSTSNSEKIEDRIICTLTEEEILQLMDPPVPPVHQDGMPSCDTTSSSNESLDSDEPKSKFTKEDSLQSYRFLDPRHVQIFHDKVLVNGDNAVVCKAEFFHLPCVAKYVHPKLTESSSWQLENFLKGCKILENCRHPNVVAVLGMLHDENLPVPVLLMELMEQSLKEFLDRAKISVPLHTQIDICCDIAQGLEYIHSKDYIHGDLTATNVLLQGNRAKICGVMSLQHNSIDAELSLCPGAPECLPRRSFSFSDYDEAIDCFSFGVLAIHIATRQIPKPPAQAVQADNISEVERYTSSLRKMRLVPKHPLHSIIIQCLNDKPNRRPSAAKLCVLISEMKTSTGYRNSFESEHLSTKLVSLQIRHMQNEVCERDKENETLRAHLESKQEEIQQKETDFQEHIQNLQGRAEGAEKELQEDRESKNRLEEEMSNRIAKLACRNSDLEEKIKAAETEIKKSKRDSESMEHSYHAELKDVTAEKNSACKNLMKERETLGTMENKFRELEAEKALVKRQLDESDTNYAKLLQAQDQ